MLHNLLKFLKNALLLLLNSKLVFNLYNKSEFDVKNTALTQAREFISLGHVSDVHIWLQSPLKASKKYKTFQSVSI